MYLQMPAIEATLSSIAAITPAGSSILVTYQDVVGPPVASLVRPIFRVLGEPLVTKLARDEMKSLLGKHGFSRVSDAGDEAWSERLLGHRARIPMSERLAHARKR